MQLRVGWLSDTEGSRAMMAFIDFCAGHGESHALARSEGAFVALRRREVKPVVGFNAGFHHTEAKRIQAGTVTAHAEVMLAAGISPLCGFAHPIGSRGFVLRHTLPAGKHHAEVELSQGMIPVGGLVVPPGSLDEIQRIANGTAVVEAETELGVRVALVGFGLECSWAGLRGGSGRFSMEIAVHGLDHW